MQNNNQFPIKPKVVLHQDKIDFLNNIGAEFQIDPAIRPIVNEINNTSLFLTNSSCEGKNGNPTSSHLDYAYVGIGVLYNQISWLEKFAYSILSTFGTSVGCSFNFSLDGMVVDSDISDNGVPNFRAFLRLDIYDRTMFSEIIHFIKKFSEEMPDIKQFSNESIYQNAEYHLSASIQQKVDELIALHINEGIDGTNLEKHKKNIRKLLGAEIDDSTILKISFEVHDRHVENLFRFLTATTKGNMKGFCQIHLYEVGKFFNIINIDLFDVSLLPVISSILKQFIESSDGKMIEFF